MLTFSVYDCDDYDRGQTRHVHVNPAAVASVEESSRRPMFGFNQPVAVIRLTTGEMHTVYDYARNVAKAISESQGEPVGWSDGLEQEILDVLRTGNFLCEYSYYARESRSIELVKAIREWCDARDAIALRLPEKAKGDA